MCTIKIFRGRGQGSWSGGDNNERCLKWGGGVGVIEEFQSKLLKKSGVGKGRNCSWREGVLTESPPLLPLP